jgi:hypothetical protein
MTHKAGGDKTDVELGAWWNAVKGQRDQLLLGAYWVLYPGNPTGHAQAFLNRLDSQCPGWRDGPFILQLDCEDWTGDGSTKPGLSDIRAACEYLIQRMPKLRPVVYASASQYGNSLAGLPSSYAALWNARYPLGSRAGAASEIYALCGGDGGKGWNAYSGQTPAIWQFTSSATIAGQTTCDANAFRGTLADLVALVAPGWETDVTPNDLLVTHIVAGGTDYGSLNGVLATLMQRTNALKGIAAVPSADDVAQAVLERLGGDTTTAAVALVAVLGKDKAAALEAAIGALLVT